MAQIGSAVKGVYICSAFTVKFVNRKIVTGGNSCCFDEKSQMTRDKGNEKGKKKKYEPTSSILSEQAVRRSRLQYDALIKSSAKRALWACGHNWCITCASYQ
uniref:Uncharacterized protein n=1 Tax=Romanomermis culicivorax TaxID=13658 RepID=A0A915IAL8_ROMCU